MSKYDNRMEIIGGREDEAGYYTFGAVTINPKFVLMDRSYVTILEQVAGRARALVDDLDASFWSVGAGTDETVMALRESLVALDDEERK